MEERKAVTGQGAFLNGLVFAVLTRFCFRLGVRVRVSRFGNSSMTKQIALRLNRALTCELLLCPLPFAVYFPDMKRSRSVYEIAWHVADGGPSCAFIPVFF